MAESEARRWKLETGMAGVHLGKACDRQVTRQPWPGRSCYTHSSGREAAGFSAVP